MSRPFHVYTTPTQTQGIAGRPNTPTSDPRIQPEVFHSYIPSLSLEEANLLDEALAHGTPVHEVTSEMAELFLTPSRRKYIPFDSTPEEALEARQKARSRLVAGCSPVPSERFAGRAYQARQVRYSGFKSMMPHRPKTPSRRVPLAELPITELRFKRDEVPTPAPSPDLGPVTPPRLRRKPRFSPQMIRTPAAAEPTTAQHRSYNFITPPSRTNTTPSTSNFTNSSVNSVGSCSSCGSTCSLCSTNTSIHSSRSSFSNASSSKRAALTLREDLDRNVRRMEGLAAKGRKLRDIIPAMTPRTDASRAFGRKTEVEKWLETEMATGSV